MIYPDWLGEYGEGGGATIYVHGEGDFAVHVDGPVTELSLDPRELRVNMIPETIEILM
jgi:hypothetical protein